MEREALEQLIAWKERENRKPLIVRGARQVGKTWLMLEFAQKAFANYVYINFEEDELLQHLFENDFNIERIISTISLRTQVDIDSSTLIIFDELQAAPRGIMALKYFYEKAPHYPVMAAGSLLGLAMHPGESFPVGKVDFVSLYPMNFKEFLMATGHASLIAPIQKGDWTTVRFVKDKLIALLRTYYYVGGMPEAVLSYCERKNLNEVRRIQENILLTYENDFSKHAPMAEVPRIRMVWHSIMGQLAKENRKFIYGMLRQGARSKDYEVAIEWLRDAGVVYQVSRTKSGELPVSAFEDYGSFKLFMLDVGLMSAMNKISSEMLIAGNELFTSYRGTLTEQYVCQQLQGEADFIYYWSADNSRGEIDFLIQQKDRVIPIEVKAEENLRAKSLAAFVAKYPSLHALRFSMSDYRDQDWMTNIPLYALFRWRFEKYQNVTY